MNDLISRQAAIDAIEAVFPVDPMKSEYAQGIACGAALAKTYVEQLPSAQPKTEERTAESVQNVPNDDLISRKAAIDKLKREEKIFYSPTGLRYLIGAIRDLPSAQPERNKGKWIKKKGSLWTLATCSVCGELSVEGDKPFCPNCGAYMRGES